MAVQMFPAGQEAAFRGAQVLKITWCLHPPMGLFCSVSDNFNYRSLYEHTLHTAEDIMYTLFELGEHYPSTKLYEVSDPDSSSSHMAFSFNYRLLDEFMQEWQLQKKELQAGQITKEEYQELKR